jgi:hypothetical protein
MKQVSSGTATRISVALDTPSRKWSFASMQRLYFFCYHKVGTALCANIARKIAALFGWQADYLPGLINGLDPSKQIITFAHSLIEFDLSTIPHKGVRLIRDPRDVWLSGYLYHQHCRERWCTNETLDLTPPILFPRVPYSQQHRSEEWKRDYLVGLNGLSYQRNLLSRDRDSGLEFEMNRYADWTIQAMLAWKHDPSTIDVKIEDLMADFDGTLTLIFRHFGIPEVDIPLALAAAASEDIGRMSDAQIAANPNIYSRSISKWRSMLTPTQIERFQSRYGEAIERLGYSLLSVAR